MNRELSALLESAGVRPAPAWEEMLLVKNDALLPADPHHDTALGFDLVVLDRGTPRHYCKVRPTDTPGFRRESELRRRLADDDLGTFRVPTASFARGTRIEVQVSPFVAGDTLQSAIVAGDDDRVLSAIRAVIRDLDAIALRARTLTDLMPAHDSMLRLAERAEPSLESVSSGAALEPGARRALGAVLQAAEPVPAIPQHGDLWGRNILLEGDKGWLLDLESFGLSWTPLYDVFHLALTTAWSGAGDGHDDLTTFLSDRRLAAGCRAALVEEARRFGFDAAQCDGLFALYLIEMSADLIRRNAGSTTHAAPFLRALHDLAYLFEGGAVDVLGVTLR